MVNYDRQILNSLSIGSGKPVDWVPVTNQWPGSHQGAGDGLLEN